MSPSKYMQDDTMEAQLYAAQVKTQLHHLSTKGLTFAPLNIEEARNLKEFLENIDQDKMEKGLAAFGLSLPEHGGQSLEKIVKMSNNAPRDHKKFEAYMRDHGFYAGETRGSHVKYHNGQNPKQWVTYSAHFKLGSTGKKVVQDMQAFLMKSFSQELRETLEHLPKRFARQQRKTARRQKKQMHRLI